MKTLDVKEVTGNEWVEVSAVKNVCQIIEQECWIAFDSVPPALTVKGHYLKTFDFFTNTGDAKTYVKPAGTGDTIKLSITTI